MSKKTYCVLNLIFGTMLISMGVCEIALGLSFNWGWGATSIGIPLIIVGSIDYIHISDSIYPLNNK